jgi:predicted 2-oxoglutarate/Fe(II)-dependent dioxygenase YbiX
MYVTSGEVPATEILGGCIAVWKNAWKNPDKSIDKINKAIEEHPELEWDLSKTLGDIENNGYSGYRTNSQFLLKNNARKADAIREMSNSYYELVSNCVEWYIKHFSINEMVYSIEDYSLLRYQTGQEFHAHYDGGTNTKRVVSPILYLNDDYEGGEIEFVNQGITIKPEAGMFLIFPANFAFSHIAHPVKTGTKYAIVTWLFDQP